MRKLDENCVYDLSELTSEELKKIWERLVLTDSDWHDCDINEVLTDKEKYNILFNSRNWEWEIKNESHNTTNAKELFYTLENIQVDCSDLSEDSIEKMYNIVVKKGYKTTKDLFRMYKWCYFSFNSERGVFVAYRKNDSEKTTITYDKFMELFGESELNKNGWYKNGNFFMYHNFETDEKYGFCHDGFWVNSTMRASEGYVDNCKLSTKEEVEERLKKEAIERGFNVGYESGKYVYFAHDKDWYYNDKSNTFFVRQNGDTWNSIMKDGVWSEKVKISNLVSDKPKQYQIGIDTFERCEANMTKEEILACVRFNIDKYTWRNKGQALEDLEKIIDYANWGIKQLKK